MTAVLLSILIVIGFEWYFTKTRPPAPPQQPGQASGVPQSAPPGQAPSTPPAAPATVSSGVSIPGAPSGATIPGAPSGVSISGAPSGATIPGAPSGATIPGAPSGVSISGAPSAATAPHAVPRIAVETPTLKGSIALEGARLDDLVFTRYFDKPGGKGKPEPLFLPRGHKTAYYAQFGWVAGDGAAAPGPDTIWTADGNKLTPDQPVTLTWNNGQGLTFALTLAVDKDYLFTVTGRVANGGAKAATLYPYGLLSRTGTPQVADIYILHEGPLGVFDKTLKEVTYADMRKQGAQESKSQGGWAGITDKYWLAALIPDQKAQATHRFLYRRDGDADRYQVDYLQGAVAVPPGATVETRAHLFAGAKQLGLLDDYGDKIGIPRFDLAIDFGWFYFLTKPIFYALIWLNKLLGNFGLAILALTVVIKLLFYPLANKSYVAMSKMKKLQPEMMSLRDRFGGDKVRMNQEMMALYKREQVNPAAGCLPILVQIPVFFALYKVLYVTIEMRHAPFYGWIVDLSALDPTTIFNLFGLIPWQPPQFLMVGIWPLIMGVTMWLQQRMNPPPPDPIQAQIFAWLPVIFTYMLASFPAGLVIYWAWNNILSIAQQWLIMKRMGVKMS
ncbi:MAG: membrane protein insertase YidC [Alphaproteobacteria bacterium]|nr:membrane protein insertase YidC [Alphaproteobacteria bacterium]